MAPIPPALRIKIAESGQHRCGYCLTQVAVTGMAMEIDHLLPVAAGGDSTVENLWLACPRCNRAKGTQTHAVDAETGRQAPLFNPRTQVWREHFAWRDAGVTVVGLTPIGRATVVALDMNNNFVIRARRVWVLWGWHPPDA